MILKYIKKEKVPKDDFAQETNTGLLGEDPRLFDPAIHPDLLDARFT